jgi:hypothetical protein
MQQALAAMSPEQVAEVHRHATAWCGRLHRQVPGALLDLLEHSEAGAGDERGLVIFAI